MRHQFVDIVDVEVRSGDGGAGCVSFRREKYVPYGGPNGGDGGRGGHVIFEATRNLSTLLDYKFRSRHHAENGRPGEGNQKTGRDGEDMVIQVPVGTTLRDMERDVLLADLSEDGDRITVAEGGRGGKGNEHFKTAKRQVPRFAQPGEPGQTLSLRLELKLLADAGLIGFPNVGKSSLISRISAAKPKIADYHFTTLVPNLGVVKFGVEQNFVVADVPGLIVGASEGAGLGSQFLRHVERVGVLVHLITAEPGTPDRDPIQDYQAIEAELLKHNPELAERDRILVLNRCDLPEVQTFEAEVRDYARSNNLPFYAISAATGQGLDDLVKKMGEIVHRHRLE